MSIRELKRLCICSAYVTISLKKSLKELYNGCISSWFIYIAAPELHDMVQCEVLALNFSLHSLVSTLIKLNN